MTPHRNKAKDKPLKAVITSYNTLHTFYKPMHQ